MKLLLPGAPVQPTTYTRSALESICDLFARPLLASITVHPQLATTSSMPGPSWKLGFAERFMLMLHLGLAVECAGCRVCHYCVNSGCLVLKHFETKVQ